MNFVQLLEQAEEEYNNKLRAGEIRRGMTLTDYVKNSTESYAMQQPIQSNSSMGPISELSSSSSFEEMQSSSSSASIGERTANGYGNWHMEHGGSTHGRDDKFSRRQRRHQNHKFRHPHGPDISNRRVRQINVSSSIDAFNATEDEQLNQTFYDDSSSEDESSDDDITFAAEFKEAIRLPGFKNFGDMLNNNNKQMPALIPISQFLESDNDGMPALIPINSPTQREQTFELDCQGSINSSMLKGRKRKKKWSLLGQPAAQSTGELHLEFIQNQEEEQMAQLKAVVSETVSGFFGMEAQFMDDEEHLMNYEISESIETTKEKYNAFEGSLVEHLSADAAHEELDVLNFNGKSASLHKHYANCLECCNEQACAVLVSENAEFDGYVIPRTADGMTTEVDGSITLDAGETQFVVEGNKINKLGEENQYELKHPLVVNSDTSVLFLPVA